MANDALNNMPQLMQLMQMMQAGQQQMMQMQNPPKNTLHQDNMTLMGRPGYSGFPGLDAWYKSNPDYTPGVGDFGQVNADKRAQRDHQLYLNQNARAMEAIRSHDEHAKLAGLPTYKELQQQKQQAQVKPLADLWQAQVKPRDDSWQTPQSFDSWLNQYSQQADKKLTDNFSSLKKSYADHYLTQ